MNAQVVLRVMAALIRILGGDIDVRRVHQTMTDTGIGEHKSKQHVKLLATMPSFPAKMLNSYG